VRSRAIHPGALRAQTLASLQAGLRAHESVPIVSGTIRFAPSRALHSGILRSDYSFTVAGAASELFNHLNSPTSRLTSREKYRTSLEDLKQYYSSSVYANYIKCK
jgi:hypothetical protein